jgi:DNA-binding transcriptional regulator YiaG
MTVARPKPEPPKEKKSVSTSLATNHMVKNIEPTKMEKLSIEPERIKAIRIKHDLSQAKFGELLNVSNVTVSLWENGKTSPSPPFVRDILKLESEAPATAEAPALKDDPPATVAVAGPVAGEEPDSATAEESVEVISDEITVTKWEFDELRKRAEESQAFAASLQARIDELKCEQTPPRCDGPYVRDNLDAFRLLVRTFGIDTADRIVDLLRA